MKLPQASIPGTVTELRELKKKDGGEVWGHSASVAAIGITFELRLNVDQFKALKVGGVYVFECSFKQWGGNLQLSVLDYEDAHGASNGVAPSAAKTAKS